MPKFIVRLHEVAIEAGGAEEAVQKTAETIAFITPNIYVVEDESGQTREIELPSGVMEQIQLRAADKRASLHLNNVPFDLNDPIHTAARALMSAHKAEFARRLDNKSYDQETVNQKTRAENHLFAVINEALQEAGKDTI